MADRDINKIYTLAKQQFGYVFEGNGGVRENKTIAGINRGMRRMARTQAAIFKKMAGELNISVNEIETMAYMKLIGYFDVTVEAEEKRRKESKKKLKNN